ncbi:MAG: PQQ-binding-like beta-propeller repeat protein [Ignavibacterium sp.]
MNTKKLILFIILLSIGGNSQDWKQFQFNSEHHGRVTNQIQPPYRVRWFWLGENLTLRNMNSVNGWPDDLNSRPGYSFPLPSNVNITISGNVQVVAKDSLLFFGTLEGDAYFVRIFDGGTVRKINLTYPIVASAAVESNIAVFANLYGELFGLSIPSGNILWKYTFPKSVTIAPVINSNKVFCADHSGRIVCLDLFSGLQIWTVELGYPVQSTPAANQNYLIVCSEDMNVNLIDINSGIKLQSSRVHGQSFRDTHPVILNNRVYVTAVPAPMFGSEWMMEEVMAGSNSFQSEETNILNWLEGNSSFPYSSPDWKNKYVFDLPSLQQPFQIASGPNDGCGSPPPSMVVDNQNRVFGWYKTRFPTLTNPTVGFGSAYGMDLMYINQTDGKRERINLGTFANMWMLESDNLYALSIFGNQIWMRQNFRGTQMINLSNANHTYVQVEAQVRDGGNFTGSDISYVVDESSLPNNPQTHWQGRIAPSFAGGFIFIVEAYGIVCIERNQ